MTFDRQRMREAAGRGHATATDLADYLVRRGMAFRDAHEAVGRLSSLPNLRSRNSINSHLMSCAVCLTSIDENVFDVLTLEGSVHSRNHVGVPPLPRFARP